MTASRQAARVQLAHNWIQRARSMLAWLEARPAVCVLASAGLGLTVAISTGTGRGLPVPAVHDEFAYLLAADTFASARVANPSHPLWQHLETFHVIHTPVYVAKYPPGQGLALALGIILFGYPIAGVWLSVALMCAALTWMLFAWLPPRWAIIGSVLAVTQVAAGSYWATSYWGGAVAASGGALVFGAVRRLVYRPRRTDTLLLGLGFGVLAASRPLEGLLLALLAIAVLGWHWSKVKVASGKELLSVLVPGMVLTSLALLALGYYNWRITGSLVRMPYAVHDELYGATPPFPWQRVKNAVSYRHAEIKTFWTDWERGRLEAMRRPSHVLQTTPRKLAVVLFFYLGYSAVALLALPIALRDPWVRVATLSSTLVLAAVLMTTASFPHYAAPAMCLIYFTGLACLRSLTRVRPPRFGISALVMIVLLVGSQHVRGTRLPLTGLLAEFGAAREGVRRLLVSTPGRDLVVVRYRENHSVHEEWVHNRADIDNSAIVWARDMGPVLNRRLLEYFGDRRVWLLEVGGQAFTLRPFPSAGA